ncbi:uncharacterized protein [Euwallacea fornicatus]|uniref:uncharacterized protein n=1 Tax=Euwallacea fornicatus TaxID=995702 RepID=UPI00338DCA1B
MGTVIFGSGHATSILGLLKIIEIISCLLGLILALVGGTWTNSLLDAFFAATCIGIIISGIIFIYCSSASASSNLKVLRYNFTLLGALFVFLLIVSSILIAKYYTKYHKAGGIFGLIASLFYLIDCGLSYKSYGF